FRRVLFRSRDDARWLRLRQGIPRRALHARGDDPAHRSGEPAAHPVLHRRARAGAAQVVLGTGEIASSEYSLFASSTAPPLSVSLSEMLPAPGGRPSTG